MTLKKREFTPESGIVDTYGVMKVCGPKYSVNSLTRGCRGCQIYRGKKVICKRFKEKVRLKNS